MAQAQQMPKEEPKTTRILFLLDASGSMLARWQGEFRIDIAKRVLGEMITELDGQPRLETALRVYGHQYPKAEQNCNDTRLEAPFAPNNSKFIKERLVKVKPKGTTPLAKSLEKCGGDFPDDPNGRNIIIIITDGIESCDGDPCAVSLMLQRKNIFLKPFIIGIGMTEDYTENFGCLGTFLNAEDPSEFRSVLKKAVDQTIAPTSVRVEILDMANRPTETNLPVSFINDFTGTTAKQFVHLLKAGQPEEIDIDPVLSYDLKIQTIPPVYKKDVDIIGGRDNVIKVKAPTGNLDFKFSGFNAYKNLKALVRKAGDREILNIQDIKKSERYLVGRYDIEVLTTPHVSFKNVTITNKQTKTLNIAAPGILTILDGGKGYGAIYQLSRDGSEEWVMDVDRQGSYNLQPGYYKIIFRPANAVSQKFSVVKNFKITPQGSTKLRLY
jgi:Ca-activated chloride channel family protein